ncbi:uncharacterized protein LOC124530644 [Vanessa cardui]|uniref:uncharacterized protein LOC124530644 n=1 Tax=Vanessa cardui TaxID=171605 RepID=UPI001F14471F|nr:uncharacterized protein LOC124530644 [Vanessa cardui]
MAKKKKNKRIQKVVKFAEAGNITPVLKTASKEFNTEYNMRNEKDINDFNICLCDEEIDKHLPKTWQSIMDMYGNTDTTQVWDSREKNPKPLFKFKKQNKHKHKSKVVPESINDLKYDKSKAKSKYQKKNKKVKKSLITLYRKRNKHNRFLNRKYLKSEKQQEIDSNVKDNMKEKPPKTSTRFDFLHRNPIDIFYHYKGTGDYSSTQNKKQRQNGTAEGKGKPKKELVATKDMENISKGERKKRNKNTFLKDSSEKIMTMWSKCNLAKMFFNQSLSKSHNIAKNLNEEPLFEMKINSGDMRVVNSSEIMNKIINLGKMKRKHHSHKKPILIGKNDVCKEGICENALYHNQTRFDCKCRRKNNRVICSDTNCDRKVIKNPTKKKLRKSSLSKLKQSKPLVKVLLDRNNMRILNSDEIGDMFKEAPYYGICPTGICEEASKDPGIEINCKCIGRKMIKECTEETCSRTAKKYILSEICSRIFSKSDNFDSNFFRFERNKMRGQRRRHNVINRQHEIQNHKTSANTKRVLVPDPPQRKRHEVTKVQQHENIENEKKKIGNELNALIKKIRWQKKSQGRIKKSCKRNLFKCIKGKRKRLKKKIKQKEKEFHEYEKKTDKENLRIEKMAEKNRNIEEPYWNFFTKFVAGVLNVGVNLIVKMFTMTFSVLLNPIGSFVYVRERLLDPPDTIKRIIDWFARTWSNKQSKISETIKQSDTMNIIGDQIEDSAVYEAIFASQGRTGAEKSLYERKRRLRKRRIQKRYNQAMFGCRHMLLTTMRKTPCLWFYYICPDLYPQCLSLVGFMRNFCHIIIFLIALLCWTPCILFFEACRGFLCCCFCTN